MTMTNGPTIANPDAFESVDDLRRELRRANLTLLMQAQKLAQFDEVAAQIVGAMNRVLILHIKQDTSGISAFLETYLSERDSLREQLEDSIESSSHRQVH
ncbi:hypothetical protein [Paraburkholderia humisilvae]|uniref:Uncharacterized protein n=1 Tax=Paraburkholderia humisilvae TaxID=627669 RepID=A0A6J5ECH0_9BURK|nr:hypothetical protein [Paraburkholderia humisilvae]CAB3764198.1 hypothetical protein LMG29542_04811 [Paraburkholderia humisilvae]